MGEFLCPDGMLLENSEIVRYEKKAHQGEISLMEKPSEMG